mgnify:CR=1 FL=1
MTGLKNIEVKCVDINADGFIDIVPFMGMGFKYNGIFSYFKFNSSLKKFEVKPLHYFNLKGYDVTNNFNDTIGIWPHYDYKTHTLLLQEFKAFKSQDRWITGIKSYNMRTALSGSDFDNDGIPAINSIPKISKAVLTPMKHIYQAGAWTYSPSGLPISIMTGKLAVDKIKKK